MSEIEIGRGKRGRAAYAFDDIAIVPSRRTRDPQEVSITWQIDAYRFELPLLAAPMDSVVSPATAIEIGRLGGVGGVVLSMGRAIGETMAVAFVLGNNHQITSSLLDAAATITVSLANEFSEADTDIYLSSLFYLALVLFVLSFITLFIAKYFLIRAERKYSR